MIIDNIGGFHLDACKSSSYICVRGLFINVTISCNCTASICACVLQKLFFSPSPHSPTPLLPLSPPFPPLLRSVLSLYSRSGSYVLLWPFLYHCSLWSWATNKASLLFQAMLHSSILSSPPASSSCLPFWPLSSLPGAMPAVSAVRTQLSCIMSLRAYHSICGMYGINISFTLSLLPHSLFSPILPIQ